MLPTDSLLLPRPFRLFGRRRRVGRHLIGDHEIGDHELQAQ